MRIVISLFITLLAIQNAWGLSVQGHRGAKKIYPENTLAAFEYALGVGVDFIELDIHITKDGVPVVIHDPVVSKNLCLKNGRKIAQDYVIHQMKYEELADFDCGSLRNNGVPKNLAPGSKIPTFDDVIDLVLSARDTNHVEFKVDIKSLKNRKQYPPPEIIARTVLEKVWSRGIQNRSIYSSFDVNLLKQLRLQDSTSRVAYLVKGGLDERILNVAREIKAHTVSPYWLTFSLSGPRTWTKELQKEGFQVVPWTVNSKNRWESYLRAGVDGIITDNPKGLIEFLRSRPENPIHPEGSAVDLAYN